MLFQTTGGFGNRANDPRFMQEINVVVFDESHERSPQNDLASLAIIQENSRRRVYRTGPQIATIFASATDGRAFAEHHTRQEETIAREERTAFLVAQQAEREAAAAAGYHNAGDDHNEPPPPRGLNAFDVGQRRRHVEWEFTPNSVTAIKLHGGSIKNGCYKALCKWKDEKRFHSNEVTMVFVPGNDVGEKVAAEARTLLEKYKVRDREDGIERSLKFKVAFVDSKTPKQYLMELLGDYPAKEWHLILVCTNCLESSATVPGVSLVLITGVVFRARPDPTLGSMEHLLEWTSVKSIMQQAGRGGRTTDVRVHLLWHKDIWLSARDPPPMVNNDEDMIAALLLCASKNEGAALPGFRWPDGEDRPERWWTYTHFVVNQVALPSLYDTEMIAMSIMLMAWFRMINRSRKLTWAGRQAARCGLSPAWAQLMHQVSDRNRVTGKSASKKVIASLMLMAVVSSVGRYPMLLESSLKGPRAAEIPERRERDGIVKRFGFHISQALAVQHVLKLLLKYRFGDDYNKARRDFVKFNPIGDRCLYKIINDYGLHAEAMHNVIGLMHRVQRLMRYEWIDCCYLDLVNLSWADRLDTYRYLMASTSVNIGYVGVDQMTGRQEIYNKLQLPRMRDFPNQEWASWKFGATPVAPVYNWEYNGSDYIYEGEDTLEARAGCYFIFEEHFVSEEKSLAGTDIVSVGTVTIFPRDLAWEAQLVYQDAQRLYNVIVDAQRHVAARGDLNQVPLPVDTCEDEDARVELPRHLDLHVTPATTAQAMQREWTIDLFVRVDRMQDLRVLRWCLVDQDTVNAVSADAIVDTARELYDAGADIFRKVGRCLSYHQGVMITRADTERVGLLHWKCFQCQGWCITTDYELPPPHFCRARTEVYTLTSRMSVAENPLSPQCTDSLRNPAYRQTQERLTTYCTSCNSQWPKWCWGCPECWGSTHTNTSRTGFDQLWYRGVIKEIVEMCGP